MLCTCKVTVTYLFHKTWIWHGHQSLNSRHPVCKASTLITRLPWQVTYNSYKIIAIIYFALTTAFAAKHFDDLKNILLAYIICVRIKSLFMGHFPDIPMYITLYLEQCNKKNALSSLNNLHKSHFILQTGCLKYTITSMYNLWVYEHHLLKWRWPEIRNLFWTSLTDPIPFTLIIFSYNHFVIYHISFNRVQGVKYPQTGRFYYKLFLPPAHPVSFSLIVISVIILVFIKSLATLCIFFV